MDYEVISVSAYYILLNDEYFIFSEKIEEPEYNEIFYGNNYIPKRNIYLYNYKENLITAKLNFGEKPYFYAYFE